MPQLISCPDCGRKLRVPDDLIGKKVKCPGCGIKFVGAADDAPPDEAADDGGFTSEASDRPSSAGAKRVKKRSREEDPDEDAPRSRRRRGGDDDDEDHGEPSGDPVKGWQRVRLGLNLVITAAWVYVGEYVVGIIGGVLIWAFGMASIWNTAGNVAATGPTQPAAGQAAGGIMGTFAAMGIGFILLVGFVALLVLVEHTCRLTGYGICIGVVPPKRDSILKGLAIAVFALGIGNMLAYYGGFCGGGGLDFLAAYANAANRNSGGGPSFAGVGMSLVGLSYLLYWAEKYTFLFFLRGAAVAAKQDGIGMGIVWYMVALPIVGVLLVLGGVLVMCGGGLAMFGAAANSVPNTSQGVPTQGQFGNAAGNMAGAAVGWMVAIISCWGITLLILLAMFIWYVVILYQTRWAVVRLIDRD